MDKVFSTRLDAGVLDELDRLSRKLGLSKRQVLEESIRHRAGLEERAETDVWAETCGAWRRRESPRTTVQRARRAFETSMHRHHR